MDEVAPPARLALSERLLRHRDELAAAVTEQFLQRHPDWLARYGEKAREAGCRDAGFHVEFLAGALQVGQAEPFEEYARWAARILSARGIAPAFLAENLQDLDLALSAVLASEDRQCAGEVIRAGVRACLAEPAPAPPDLTPAGLRLTRNLFTQAILNGRRHAAVGIALAALEEGHALLDLYVDVVQEALYAVGRLWESNRITVAGEHMATAITQYVMAQLYARIPLAVHSRGKAVVTGVLGESHHVGANMVADVLEADGWDVRFLGTNLPHSGIVDLVEEHGADLLCVSTTMVFNIRQTRQLIRDVRQKFAVSCPHILVGGAAFRFSPELFREVEADAMALDAREAIAVAGAL